MTAKTIFTIIVFSISQLGCSENEQLPDLLNDSFISTWVQFENAFSPGSGIVVQEIEDGDVLIIEEAKVFTWQSSEIREGTWNELNEDEIEMTFTDGQVVSFKVEIESDIMKLTPTNPICIEGCYTRWERGDSYQLND